ncbi:hypothetical protein Mal65_05990 [Crateriforma conspicua]|nr:hypothetical protein Mal65_05990 [Crateriforma conspicua]
MEHETQLIARSGFAIEDFPQTLPAGHRLQERCLLPELMDDPRLDDQLHYQALDGLRRINRISRCSKRFWPTLKQLANTMDRPLRVLDVATGGGDVVASLSRMAQRSGTPMQIDGCDISRRALRYARLHAETTGMKDCRFFAIDVLKESLPGEYDVILNSLFLHHLTRCEAVRVLANMAAACRRAVLISDLRRTRWGYFLAAAGSRLITRSPIVHLDGAQSVRAAWSDTEIKGITHDAGLGDGELTFHWPQRFFLKWCKP